MATQKQLRNSLKNSPVVRQKKSHFSKFTRAMAMFTASLFLASSNLAYAAQPNGLGGHNANSPMFEGMSRREIRQQIRQERHNGIGIPERGLNLNNINNGVVPQPTVTNVQAPHHANNNHGNAHRNQLLKNNHHQVIQQLSSGQTIKLDNGANLDLTASERSITLGDRLVKNGGSINIEVGGEKKTLYAGSQVTAAEYVAAKQVLSGGGQKLVVDANGRATGGSVQLDQLAATKNTMKASSLVVASGVTAVGDLDKQSNFKLNGDLTNFGSVYAVNTKGSAHRAAEITADNITNNEGALISSNAGTAHGNQQSSIDLSLTANNDVTNFGTIESSGDLSITAGSSIKNGGSGQITAAQNVNLNSAQINNAGVVSAQAGNLTVDAPGALAVNNVGGTFSASNAINVRPADYNGSGNTTVTGGDLLSQQLNLNAGQGTTDVNVGQLSGVVKSSGSAVHVQAATDNLVLGQQCLTGDPTYFNTGDITISGDFLVGGQDLAILATGDIVSTAGVNIISTGGGDITLVAGATLVPAGGATPFPGFPAGPPIGAGQTVTVTGADADGGNIDFSLSPTITIDSSTGIGPSGNIGIYAYRNGGTGGNINLPDASTVSTAEGVPGAVLGNIEIVGGGNVQTGNVYTFFGAAGTGSITIASRNPDAGAGITFNEFGTASGAFGSTAVGALGNVSIGSNSSNTTVTANNFLTVDSTGTFSKWNGTAFGQNGFSVNAAGNILLSNAGFSANNGPGTVATPGIISTGGLATFFDASNGALSLNIGGNLIDASGVGGGGQVNLSANSIVVGGATALTINADGINGPGGNIFITANGSTSDITIGPGAGQFLLSARARSPFLGADGMIFNTAGSINLVSGDDNVVAIPDFGFIMPFFGAPGSNNGGVSTNGNVFIGTTGFSTFTPSPFPIINGTNQAALNWTDLNPGNTGAFVQGLGTPTSYIVSWNDIRYFAGSGTGAFNGQIGLLTAGNTLGLPAGTIVMSYGLTQDAGSAFTNLSTIGLNQGSGSLSTLNSLGIGNAAGQLTRNTLASSLAGRTFAFTPNGGNYTVTEIAPTNANGGLVQVQAGRNLTVDNNSGANLRVNGIGGGNGGNITLRAGAFFQPGALTVNGPLNASATGSGTGGNITLSARSASNLSLSANGQVTANSLSGTAGNISITNFGTGGVTVNAPMSVNGANSGTITINSPGTTTLSAPITGNGDLVINSTGTINIGQVTLTGAGSDIILKSTAGGINVNGALQADPIIMLAALDINLGADVIADDGILLVTSQSINSTAGGVDIFGGSNTGDGGNVVLIAGANFTDNGGVSVTVNTPSATGGNINLTASGASTVTSASTAFGAFDAGNVSLIAYANGGNGQILLSTLSNIDTTASVLGNSGTISVVAGATSGTGIQLGELFVNTLGSNQSGAANISASTPSNSVVIDQSVDVGSYATDAFLGGTTQSADISTGNITARGVTVNVTNARNILLGNVNVSGTGGSGGLIKILAGGTAAFDTNGGSVINGALSLNAAAGSNGAGGEINVTNLGLGGITVSSATPLNATNGAGGTYVFNANLGTLTIAGGDLSVNAAGTDQNGGGVALTAQNIVLGGNVLITANSTGTGLGGGINIISLGGALTLGTGAGEFDLGVTGVGGGILVTAGTFLSVNGDTSAELVGLRAVSNSLILNANVNADPTNGLAALRAGENIIGTGTVQGFNVTLTADTGNIGTDAASRITTNATNVTATANGGSIYLQQLAALNLNAITAGNDIQIATGGTLTVNGVISADPITMTSAADIVLNNDVVANNGILLVAGQNISTGLVGVDIDGGSNTGSGGKVVIIAGANFAENVADIDILGASGTGGNINFTSSALNSITTRSTNVGNNAGGDLTLLAFENGGSNGAITLPTAVTITTGGTGLFGNGSVTIVAGATSGTGVSVGAINTTGGATNTGDVSIFTAAPNTPVTVNKGATTGSYLTNAFLGGAAAASDISVGAITTSFADVVVNSGHAVTLNGTINGDAVTVQAGGNGTITQDAAASILGNSVQLNADTGNIGGAATPISVQTNTLATFTNGGSSYILANGAVNVISSNTNGGDMQIGSNGTIDVLGQLNTFGGFIALYTTGGAIVLDHNVISGGGAITMVAAGNISSGPGGVLIDSSTLAGSGNNDINIVAGAAVTNSANNLTITGRSGLAGFINFIINPPSAINASTSTGSSGDVNLVAYTDVLGGSIGGQIDVACDIITNASDNAGNVSIVAERTFAGNSMNLANILASGSSSGLITLSTSVPNNVAISKIFGAGGFFYSNTIVTSGISVGQIATNQGDVDIESGLGVTLSNNIDGDQISVHARSTGNLTQTGGTITGTRVQLRSESGDIGAAGTSAISTDAGFGAGQGLSAISTSGSVYIRNTGSVTLRNSGASNDFQLTATGTIQVAGTVIADPITMTATGDIELLNDLTADGGMLLVAGGNIYTNAADVEINGSSSFGNAGAITMVAGAAFTENAGTVQVTGASATGGLIDFQATPIQELTSESTFAGGNGGNLTLVAFDNGGAGRVLLPAGLTVTTGGTTTGTNGYVAIVAGATSGFGIDVGSIDTTGGQTGTGNIDLRTTTPNTPVTIDKGLTTGQYTAGAFFGGAIQNSTVSIGGTLTVDGATITIISGGGINLGNINTNGGNLDVNSGSANMTVGLINTAGGYLSLITTGGGASIFLFDDLITQGGAITLLASGDIVVPTLSNVDIDSSNAGGAGGNINIVAGAAVTDNGTDADVTGRSTFGGNIDLGLGLNTINANGLTNAGTVNLTAFSDSVGPLSVGGRVLVSSSISISGATANGVFVVAEQSGVLDGITIGSISAINSGSQIVLTTASPTNLPVNINKTSGGTSNTFVGGALRSSNISVGQIDQNNLGATQITSGDGVLLSGNINTNSLNIQANGTGNIASTGGTLTASIMSLSSQNGNIGDPAGPLSINAGATPGALTANSSGGSVYLSEVDSVSLGVSSAAIDFQIETGGALFVDGAVTADPITMISAGDINLNADLVANDGILLVSSGNIKTTAAGVNINGSGGVASDGGTVTIIAGADFTNNVNDVDINGPSATGGDIDFLTTPINSLTSNATTFGFSGGNMSLIAYENGGLGGHVLMPTTFSPQTNGMPNGINGNFHVVAGATSGVGIQVGDVSTVGGQNATGSIVMFDATPNSGVTVGKGATTGDYPLFAFFNYSALQDGSITTGNLTTFGAAANVISGGNVTVGNVITTGLNGGQIFIQGDGPLVIGGNPGTLQADGQNSGAGQIVVISTGAGGITLNPLTNISAQTLTNGPGGSIVLDAGLGDLVIGSGTLSVNGVGTDQNGGFINLSGNGIQIVGGVLNLQANATGTGIGGTITVDTSGGAGPFTALNVGTAAGEFTVQANGAGGLINISSGDALNVNAGGGFTADVIFLNSGNGADITINQNVGGATTNLMANNAAGNFVLTGTTQVTSATMFITAFADVVTAAGARLISNGQMDLLSNNGNIGTLLAPVNIDASNVVANAPNGSVFLNELNTVNIGTGNSSAATVWSIVAPGNITSTLGSLITATDVSIRSINGTLTLDGNINGSNSVTLRAFGNLTSNVAANVTTQQLVLVSDFGSIGVNSLNPFNTNVPFLTAQALFGNVFLSNSTTGNVVLQDFGAFTNSASPIGTYSLVSDNSAGGNIFTLAGSDITAGDILIISTGGGLALAGDLNGFNTVELRSFNTITNGSIAGDINTAFLTLQSTGGDIGTSSVVRLIVDVPTLRVIAFNNVFLSDPNSLVLGGGASSAGNIFDALATGSINNQSTISGTTVVLRSINSSLIIDANISSNTANLRAGTNMTTNGAAVAGQFVTLVTDNGNIGSNSVSRFSTFVDQLRIVANGSAFIDELDAVDIGNGGASTATGTLDVRAFGTLSSSQIISADVVVLRSTNADIDLNADVIATTSVSLRSSTDLLNNGVNAITAPLINLTSDNGSIGFDTNNRFIIDAINLSANALNGNVFISDQNDINLTASNAFGSFIVDAGNNLSTSGNISADAIELRAVNGSLSIGANLNGVTEVRLQQSGSITSANITGNINTALLRLTSDNGSIGSSPNPLSINVPAVAFTAPNGSVNFLSNNILTIVGATVGGTLNVGSSAGLITTGPLTAGEIVLAGGTGFVSLGGALTATIGDVSILANSSVQVGGNITAAAIIDIQSFGDITFTNDVLLNAGTDLTLNASNFINGGAGIDVLLLSNFTINVNQDVTVGGNFGAVANGAGATVNVQGVDAGGFVDLIAAGGTVTANGAIDSGITATITSGSFTTGGSITAAANVNITTNLLNNTFDINGNIVNVSSLIGSGLTIDGSAGPGGSLNGTTSVNLGVFATGDITFIGEQTFNGTTNIDPSNGNSVIVSNGAVVVGNDTVNLNTCSLILQGTGTISGNPLNFNCPNGAGTIANSSGDVDLSVVGLVFNGQSLAILASGNVIAGAATLIDLDNNAGDGGNLLVVAGFDFTPSTGGVQVNNSPIIYTIGSASSSGGSIDFTGLDITTTGDNGGNVTLIAAGGTLNSGSIIANNIIADGLAGDGGDILVIGQGGFIITSISNDGTVNDGLVNLAAAQPQIVGGPIYVQNGEQAGPGVFVAGPPTGNGTIANNAGNVDLTGLTLNFTGLDLAIIASGNVIAGTNTSINLNNAGGDGGNLLVVAGFDFTPNTGGQVNFDNGTLYTFGAASTTGGDINFTGLNITVNGGAGDGGNVTLVAADGTVGNGVITVGNISATGTGGNGGDLLVIAEGGFTTGSINLAGAVNGTATLAAAAPVITGGPITVQSGVQGGTGQFTFTVPTGAGTIANSGGDVTLTGNIIAVGQNLAILASGNINAGPATLIDLSNGGGAGGTVTMVAGFNFAPPTVGQVLNTSTTYTIGAVSAGGSINLGAVDVNVSGSTAGGSVTAVANNGSVSLGDIDASGGTGAGGTVNIIGENGITVGAIDTTGTPGGGDINLLVSQPTITGGAIQVTNGNVSGGGFFTPGALGAGGVTINGALASGGGIAILANLAAGITTGVMTAVDDVFITNTGNVTVSGNITTTSGAINVTSQDIAGTANALIINADLIANTAINIINNGTDKKIDTLLMETNSSLTTTNKLAAGDISIRMGAVSAQLGNNNLPKAKFDVTETGGTLNLFGKKPRGEKPVNTLTAQGADINITLQKGFTPKQLIFNGGVTVLADPPVAAGTPVYHNGKLVGGYGEQTNVLTNASTASALSLVSNSEVNQLSTNAVPTMVGTIENGLANALGLGGTASTITGNGTVGTINVGTAETINAGRTETLFGAVDAIGDDNSYMVSAAGPSATAEASICSDMELGLGTDGVRSTTHGDRVVLKKGNVLFVPFRNTVVETPQGLVSIEAKSTVLVSVNAGRLAVYDVDDSHKGAVSVNAHGRTLTLAPGSHVTVANDNGEFAQVNAIEAIPHRNVATRSIKPGVRVHTSEFSVVSAIQTVKPLQAVVGSKHPQAKKVAARLMKTTAVILTVGSQAGYQHYFKPALTAMAK